jgi:hypothetical protein
MLSHHHTKSLTVIGVPAEELSMSKLGVVFSKTLRQRKGTSSTNLGKEMENDANKNITKEKRPKFMMGCETGCESNQSYRKMFCKMNHKSHVNETN